MFIFTSVQFIKKRRQEDLHFFNCRDAGASEQDCIKVMSGGGQAGQAADIALWETKLLFTILPAWLSLRAHVGDKAK